MNTTLSSREKKMILFTISLIIVVILFKLIILPLKSNYQYLQTTFKKREVLLKKSGSTLENAKKIKEKMIETKSELHKMETLLFNDKEEKVKLKILDMIDEFVKDSGLLMKNKNLSVAKIDLSSEEENVEVNIEEEPKYTLKSIILEGDFEGNLLQLTNFLQRLNSSEKIFIVKHLEIKNNSRFENLSINIRIEAINKEGDKSEEI